MKAINYLLFILFLTYTNSLVYAGVNNSLSVQINDTKYSDFKGVLEGGILTLYRGKDPTWKYDQNVKFWSIPNDFEGKEISFPDVKNSYQHAQMSYDKKDPSVNLSMEWLKEFSYKIKFGKEKDFKIPITIEGNASNPKRIRIQGTVIASTAGIKMNNGVIDRSFDHLDSIKWMAKDWIKRNTRSKYIFEKPDACFMENASNNKKPRRQVAACSFQYSNDSPEVQIAKLWFEKIKNKWQVIRRIESNSLFASSPIKPPFSNKPPYIYKNIAAIEFENKVYKPGGGYKRIAEPTLWPCGGGQIGNQPGWCELSYKVYKKERVKADSQEFECKFTTYIFEKDQKGGWHISKTLDSNMKYNDRKQQIIPRDLKKSWFCG